MSFCIRGCVSSGGRYVPTLVAGRAQGRANTTRRLATQRLAKHATTTATQPSSSSSLFLHDFFTPHTKEADQRPPSSLAAKDYLDSGSTYILIRGHQLVDDCDAINVRCDSDSHSELDQSLSLLPRRVTHISRTTSLSGDRMVLSDVTRLCESSPDETSWSCADGARFSCADVPFITKEATKVSFSAAQRRSVQLKPKEVNVSLGADGDEKEDRREREENLERVFETLSTDLPRFFTKSVDYKIYHPQIEFVNNIRGKTTKGILGYVRQLSFIRTVGHLKYAYVKMDVLKITMHTQDNTVRVRWRVTGITGWKVLLQFWKFKVWKVREAMPKMQETWYDGFSTFYLDQDGLVYRHVADKMMPDQDLEEVEKSKVIPAKLATPLSFSNLG